jgi:WD40 repeat protein
MGRLLLTLVLGSGVCALVAWQLGLVAPGDGDHPSKGTKTNPVTLRKENLGNDLYKPAAWPEGRPVRHSERDPIVILGNMAVIDKSECSAQIGGQLMFIGEEIPEGAAQAAGIAAFLVEPFEFTRVNHGSRDVIKFYRRLYENDVIYKDQVVGMIDIAKALGDLEIKRTKVIGAEADAKGSRLISQEAEIQFQTKSLLYRQKNIPEEEYRSAKLTKEKMYLDSINKQEAWTQAIAEETLSQILYQQHRIINKLPAERGIIQKIYRNRGDAVKEIDPGIMQVLSLDRLMAEAQVDGEYYERVNHAKRVTIEPSIVESPPKVYSGHVSAVHCIAVTNDKTNPHIVSGGDDRSVLIWNRYQSGPVCELKHPEAVKALACSPAGAKRNLLVTGCSDGTLRLYDLSKINDKSQDQDQALVKPIETGTAVTALAFSPDGKYFASGASDGSITLWNTDTAERVYLFDEKHGAQHYGTITSLRFTPQSKLVSASQDYTIRVWSLKEKGSSLDYSLAGRNGSVRDVGVSADGRWLLFDQGKTLQIRSVLNGAMVNTVQNPGGVIPFETLALFSPDSSLLLTAGASDGRLQLWKTPTESERGFEFRQLATREHAQVSCAAFAPLLDYNGEGSFAVSANKEGQIYLWPLPTADAVKRHPIENVQAKITSPGLNAGTRQFSIGVEVANPPTAEFPKGRLEPGRQVTIVID